MNEEKQSIWKSPWMGRRKVVACSLLTGVFFLVFLGLMLAAKPAARLSDVLTAALILSVCASLGGISVILFIRWLRSWRNLRRTLLGLAGFATLIAILYNVENWRGKRAWEKCKRELEAQGEVLDWNAYIPAPVQDEENIFKAPKMQEWFVGRDGTGSPGGGWKFDTNAGSVIVARLTVVPGSTNSDPSMADAVLRFDDPAARANAKKLIDAAVGPALSAQHLITFVAKPFNQIKPVHILLLTDKVRTTNEVAELFPDDVIAAPAAFRNRSRLIEAIDGNSFNVSLNLSWFATAADYLASSDPLENDFDLIREALKRPYARMDGNYQQPLAAPFPNFVAVRTTALALAQRAQCYLLLGQPDKALRELTLIHDLCRLLEGRPTGKPMTLTAAMINVSVTALYVDTVADGMRLQAWREPQLAAIQKKLAEVNLPPYVAEAFQSERAAVCRFLETTKQSAIYSVFFDGKTKNLSQKMTNPLFLLLTVAPRGWCYENMITDANLMQNMIDGYDLTNGWVLPQKINRAAVEAEATASHFSPYTFLASIAVPNFIKASQTLGRNQTLVNEGQIVCALERYRSVHGKFPETLDALVPQFIEKLPHDIIGGQPLKYRRTDDGKFLLYSIGWNEKDDGGQVVRNKDGTGNMADGDWVWGVSMK